MDGKRSIDFKLSIIKSTKMVIWNIVNLVFKVAKQPVSNTLSKLRFWFSTAK